MRQLRRGYKSERPFRSAINSATCLSNRAGVSLIQMMVVISLIGVITTVSITMIITMLRSQERATDVWMTQRNLIRLSVDFRRDAHSARSAEIATQNDQPVLIFKVDDTGTKTVRYARIADQVTRQAFHGKQHSQSESYRLPGCDVRFEGLPETPPVSKVDSRVVVSGQALRLTCLQPNSAPLNTKMQTPRHNEHIVAVIGRDHRLEKRASTETVPAK